jgi:ElaB/YqjD/DUF883 family membrane-anchored ribosome-binding protein
MRHHTAVSTRHNGHARSHALPKRLVKIGGSLSHTAGRLRGKTKRLLAKSVRTVKTKTKHLPKDIDRAVINHRYETIGVAMIAGLCIGYFLKK